MLWSQRTPEVIQHQVHTVPWYPGGVHRNMGSYCTTVPGIPDLAGPQINEDQGPGVHSKG